MEQLIKVVTEKAGISEAQAKQSIEAVMGFLKDKMPAGIGSQVESFISGNASSIGNVADGLKDKIGGLFNK
jgi:hypothetical protein